MREQRYRTKTKSASKESESKRKPSNKKPLDNNVSSNTSQETVNQEPVSTNNFGWMHSTVAVVLVSLAVYIAGFLLTTVAAHVYDFKSMPNKGNYLYNRTSREPIAFQALYPKFRKFAITNNNWEIGTESQFTRHGVLLTGVFFHTVLNAFHWTLEIKIANLRLMVLIPFILFLIANFVLFFKIIPASKRTQANATTYSTAVGVTHAFLVLIVYAFMSFIFPSFGELFCHPYLYSGAQMPIMIPTALVMVLTGFTLGAICGGIISGLLFVKAVLSDL